MITLRISSLASRTTKRSRKNLKKERRIERKGNDAKS